MTWLLCLYQPCYFYMQLSLPELEKAPDSFSPSVLKYYVYAHRGSRSPGPPHLGFFLKSKGIFEFRDMHPPFRLDLSGSGNSLDVLVLRQNTCCEQPESCPWMALEL